MDVGSVFRLNNNFTTDCSVQAGQSACVLVSGCVVESFNHYPLLSDLSAEAPAEKEVTVREEIESIWRVADAAQDHLFSVAVSSKSTIDPVANCIEVESNSLQDSLSCISFRIEDSTEFLINKELAESYTGSVSGCVGDVRDVFEAIEPKTGRQVCIQKQQLNL